MSIESLLIWTLVITIPALWLWDKACQRFWRWWRTRHLEVVGIVTTAPDGMSANWRIEVRPKKS